MTNQAFEIEIKSLLGTQDKADALREKLKTYDPNLELVEESKQLNHYFVGGDLHQVAEKILKHLPVDQHDRFHKIVEQGKNFSVRTRQLADAKHPQPKVLLVIKASIDDTTSSNGISRMEFEAETPDLSIEELDQLLIDSGLTYQAKWSRQREAYKVKNDVTVSLDKNAGYGYLAEFETIVHDAASADQTKTALRSLMSDLGAEELAQDRLERMFAHYNSHWPEYYGTDKVFTVE